jgi:hypothetical protein
METTPDSGTTHEHSNTISLFSLPVETYELQNASRNEIEDDFRFRPVMDLTFLKVEYYFPCALGTLLVGSCNSGAPLTSGATPFSLFNPFNLLTCSPTSIIP